MLYFLVVAKLFVIMLRVRTSNSAPLVFVCSSMAQACILPWLEKDIPKVVNLNVLGQPRNIEVY